MYHTTGFFKEEIVDLCEMIHSHAMTNGSQTWPPILGLFKSVVVSLTYTVCVVTGSKRNWWRPRMCLSRRSVVQSQQ